MINYAQTHTHPHARPPTFPITTATTKSDIARYRTGYLQARASAREHHR